MKRTIMGFGLASLILAMGTSCSKDKDEDEGGQDAGALLDVQGPEEVVVPCDDIIGLDTEECDTSSQESQSLEVNMLLVMDKSGSMEQTPSGYDMNKWEALRTALGAALVDVQDRIKFGLEFFPTSADPEDPIPADCSADRCCEMPGGHDMNVPISRAGAAAVDAILEQLDTLSPAGGTPTGMALNRAAAYFENEDLSGRSYVLLATDGGPNCNPDLECGVDECTLNIDEEEGCPADGFSCCNNNSSACLDTGNTVAAIENLRDMGVQTIVVGIPGSEAYAEALQQFAEAGGFERPDADADTPAYYEVSAEGGVAELTDVFRDITVELVTDCELPLDVNWDEVDKLQVNVAVNCEIVAYSETPPEDENVTSWWRYDNPNAPTALVIEGELCAQIEDEGVDRIDAVFGCDTRIIE